MKKFSLLLIATIFVCTCFHSCKNNVKSPKLSTVDSLYKVLDTIEQTLSKVDSAHVNKVFTEYQQNISKIKLYFDDKKEDSIWSTITVYGVIRKPLKEYRKNIADFNESLSFSRKQLDSLKADILANNIAEDKIAEYTKTEAEAVNSLNQHIKIVIPHAIENLHLFDSLNPKIIRIIERLEKTGVKKTTKVDADDDDE